MSKKIKIPDTAVIEKNPQIHSIKTEEGIIISRADLKDDSIYYLDNPVSVKIWQFIKGKSSLRVIKENLLSEYEVNKGKLDRDLRNFLEDLKTKKLIRVSKK